MKENLQSKVSQIECMQSEVSQVKQEALRWKNELASKKAELTQLKGSTEEMAKLKEDIETLTKENAELQGDLEAQRVQVSYVDIESLTADYITEFLLLRLLFGSKTLTVNAMSVNKQQDVEMMNKQGNTFTISSFKLNLTKFTLRIYGSNLS